MVKKYRASIYSIITWNTRRVCPTIVFVDIIHVMKYLTFSGVVEKSQLNNHPDKS